MLLTLSLILCLYYPPLPPSSPPPSHRYDVNDPPDVFIAWRYFASISLGNTAGSKYLWLQDTFSQLRTQLTVPLVESMDGIFTLSDFHSRILPEYV